MSAPALARARAMDLPMPREAPVTRATREVRADISCSLALNGASLAELRCVTWSKYSRILGHRRLPSSERSDRAHAGRGKHRPSGRKQNRLPCGSRLVIQIKIDYRSKR